MILSVCLILLVSLGVEAVGEVVATARTGALYRHDLDRWRGCGGRRAKSASAHRAVEAVAVQRALRQRFVRSDLGQRRDVALRARHIELRLAAGQLRRHVAATAAPSEADLRRYYRDHGKRFEKARRWRLENLFKRFPDDASQPDRERFRRRMGALRIRLLEGEAFARLVVAESDSATRLRDGRMGLVTLEELAPAVALEVAKLGPGDLSPVIETADGLTFVRCTEVIEARSPTFDEVRSRIERMLQETVFRAAWQALGERLLAELEPRIHPPRRRSPGEGEQGAMVTWSMVTWNMVTWNMVTWKKGAAPAPILYDDFALFVTARGVRPGRELPPARRDELRQERVILEARAFEAQRRGLTTTAEYRTALECERAELEATIALAEMSTAYFAAPTQADLERVLKARGAELERPQRVHLRVLELPIDREESPVLYDRVRRIGARMARGELSLEQAHEALAARGRLRDLGWLTADQAWQLGLSVQRTVDDLEPGQSSAAVQEGRRLMFLHLVDREAARPLTPEEAEARMRVLLERRHRRHAENRARAAILKQEQIEYPSDGEL